MTDDQVARLEAAGFQKCKIKAGRTGPWLWEYRGRIYSVEAALERLDRTPASGTPRATPMPTKKKADPLPEKRPLPDGVTLEVQWFGGKWSPATLYRHKAHVYSAAGAVGTVSRLRISYDPAVQGASNNAYALGQEIGWWGYQCVEVVKREEQHG